MVILIHFWSGSYFLNGIGTWKMTRNRKIRTYNTVSTISLLYGGWWYCKHRRRINTEEKAKVVAAESFYSIPCRAIAILYQDNFEEKDEFILFFK